MLHLWLQDVLQLGSGQCEVSKLDIAVEDLRLAGHAHRLWVLVLSREGITIDNLLGPDLGVLVALLRAIFKVIVVNDAGPLIDLDVPVHHDGLWRFKPKEVVLGRPCETKLALGKHQSVLLRLVRSVVL